MLLMAFGLFIGTTVAMADTRTQQTSGDKPISVFILVGQSNMVGCAYANQIKGEPPEAREDILHAYKIPPIPWKKEAVEIVSDGFVALDMHERNGQTRFGPELTLGATLRDTILKDEEIALIKFARGGSNLFSEWNPQAKKGELLYKRSLTYIEEQLSALREKGYAPVVRGLFWFQGEADSNASRGSAKYADNLKALIDAFRRDLEVADLPVVVARINPTKPVYTGAAEVRQAIVDVTEADPHAGWIDVDDQNFPDRLHIDAAGQFAAGQRFAEAWAAIALK